MLALGGAAFVPANAAVLKRMEELLAEAPKQKIDPNLTVLLSDIHICGEFKEDGTPAHYPYNPTSSRRTVLIISVTMPVTSTLGSTRAKISSFFTCPYVKIEIMLAPPCDC